MSEEIKVETTAEMTEPEPAAVEEGKKTKTTKEKVADALRIVLWVVALYCLVGWAFQLITGQLFFPFGYRFVEVQSSAMRDTLDIGDVVLVKGTKNVEENDVIFFVAEDGAHILHRHIGTDRAGNILAKGDAESDAGINIVTPKQLQGRVVKTLNWVANVKYWFHEIFN